MAAATAAKVSVKVLLMVIFPALVVSAVAPAICLLSSYRAQSKVKAASAATLGKRECLPQISRALAL
jgi:hypothetical protein